MLTTEGKNHIRRYLAGYNSQIAGAIGFGIGSRIESGNDINLQFETVRSEIDLVRYDFATNKLIFRAPVPLTYAGMIYEVGLYSQFADVKAGAYGTKMIAEFSPTTELWVDSTTLLNETYSATNSRIESGILHAPALNTTKTSSYSGVTYDLSGYDNNDFITLAMNVGNTNTASVAVTFLTNSTNYFTLTLTTPVQSAGYKIFEVLKSNAVATGSPDWGAITEVRISTTSSGSGASNVLWDGLLMADNNNVNLDYTLVARKVLTTPVVSVEGQTQNFEFTMDVTV